VRSFGEGGELELELVLLCWRKKKGSRDDKAVGWLHEKDKDAARHVASRRRRRRCSTWPRLSSTGKKGRGQSARVSCTDKNSHTTDEVRRNC